MRLFWHPRSLATQTSALLIVGLAVVELTGLAIHALDHMDFASRSQLHQNQLEVLSIYRTVAGSSVSERQAALADLHLPVGTTVLLSPKPDPLIPSHPCLPPPGPKGFLDHMPPEGGPSSPPPSTFADPQPRHEGEFFLTPHPPLSEDHHPALVPERRPEYFGDRAAAPYIVPGKMQPSPQLEWGLLPSPLYPRGMWEGRKLRTRSVSLLLPDNHTWLVVRFLAPLPNPFGSPTFFGAFMVMSILGSALIVWGSHRLIAPVSTLANAAESLGRDVNTAALPEQGPSEIKRAAIAFNTMANRLRRFITDRTLMLTAIGHDLRTPITRLKLRAEFIDDDELRSKILLDLDEMEAMVDATLAFGRDSASNEPLVTLDLRALIQTIMDEAAESTPDLAPALVFDPPAVPVKIRARSVALKRALNNLVLNALKYGRSAYVSMELPQILHTPSGYENLVRLNIEDEGPGIASEQLERVFEPFVRVETSRNRETGGTGLGLSIARTILRGQGGDVRLENRSEGGLRAVVTLVP